MQTKLSPYYLLFVAVILHSTFYILHSTPALASGASIYFGPADLPIAAGYEFAIPVLVNSDQPLNAYSISISYDPKMLELKGFERSHSIIDVSQKEPDISAVGSIRFKGGSTSPFKGAGGELLRARFKALQEGPFDLHIVEAVFYLANGKGTKIVPGSLDAHLLVQPSTSAAPGQNKAPQLEGVPAKIRFLSFENDPINPDQKFLSFSVQDSGSGIQKILYQSRSFLAWSSPQPAINPVALSKNVWSASLIIIDDEGRSVETTIYDWPALFYSPLSAFALLLVAVVITAINVLRKRKRV